MKKMATILALVALLASALLAGCGGKEAAPAAKPAPEAKKYVIATDATYAPFEFEKDGKYVGIDIDLLAAIAKLENFTYELKPMNFQGIIPALQAGQIDGSIAGMTINDKRKEVVDFSVGYFESGLSAVVNKQNTTIKSEADFMGKVFAVKKGTVGATYAEANKDKFKSTIKYFDDTPSMFQEVINGNADITFEDYPVIAYAISTDANSKLRIAVDKISKDYYGFAVKKGMNKELLDKFNSGFKKLKDSGEYDKIVKNYIK